MTQAGPEKAVWPCCFRIAFLKNLKENGNEEKSSFLRNWEFLVLIPDFFFVLVWLCVPVYRVLFRLKCSTLSGRIIKCLLTEFA